MRRCLRTRAKCSRCLLHYNLIRYQMLLHTEVSDEVRTYKSVQNDVTHSMSVTGGPYVPPSISYRDHPSVLSHT
jgi:hypothetical protein